MLEFWRAIESYRMSTTSVSSKFAALTGLCHRYLGVSVDSARAKAGGHLALPDVMSPANDAHAAALQLRALFTALNYDAVAVVTRRVNKWRARKQSTPLPPSDLFAPLQALVETALVDTALAEFVDTAW